jgi:hypothetical protein
MNVRKYERSSFTSRSSSGLISGLAINSVRACRVSEAE